MTDSAKTGRDEDLSKGAVEDDGRTIDTAPGGRNSSMAGQLGHRDQDDTLKDNDTDFPEPDAEAEYSGE